MKYLIFLLAVLGTVHSADVIKTMVCETWKGWGYTYANSTCSSSIATSCDALFDIVPEFVSFLTSFNITALFAGFGNLYTFITETTVQIYTCQYYAPTFGTLGVVLLPVAVVVLINAITNFNTIWTNVKCVYTYWTSGNYYEAGLCLGYLQKKLL